MLELPGVSLVCVDTVNHALALRALIHSQRGVRYGRTLFLTDAIPEGVTAPASIAIESIAPFRSRDDCSRFLLKSLLRHVHTPHVLLIQWDGYVVNAAAYDPAFVGCDYIGAKGLRVDDGMGAGNGGFSLQSRKLLEALQDERIGLREAEDNSIGRAFRPLLEQEYGIRYASEALADRFAFEASYPVGMPFGFQGLHNFCRVMPPGELAELATRFSDAIARSVQLSQLLRNCIALAQWDAAASLAQRRLAAMPDDGEARMLLERADAGQPNGPVVGRNDPCPCGSGKRYKQCHGGVGPIRRGIDSTSPSPSNFPGGSLITVAAQAEASLSAAAHAHQGLAAHQRGDVGSAERAYRVALGLEPGQPLALHYLGVTLHQRNQHAEALPLIERSVARVPQEPEFHNNLGLVLSALDRNEEAVVAFRGALALKPHHATAWNNLGLAWQAMNRLDDAVDSFRRAIEASPVFAHAHWNLSLALLACGEYDEGWGEYEWRLRLPELGAREQSLPIPRWQGEDLRGRTLLVTAEQGLGDALQFVRFAERLSRRGIRVIVQAPVEIRRLLATARGVAATIGAGDPLPDADAEIPMLSLPLRLGITADDVAAGGRYLHADAELKRAAEPRLRQDDRRTRNIGIAWAGSPNHPNDRRRSIPLAALAPLFSLPNLAWYSLQKGAAAAQIQGVDEARSIVPLDQRNEFAETAALVDSLDAVVTVDTSIAHLAAALGKAVHVLLPFAPDWRWGIGGSRTPWYETARLYRQPAVGEWGGAVAALRDALEAEPEIDG